MTTTDLRRARREARQTAQMAVRAFAREPNVDHEQAVQHAWARVRLLSELVHRRTVTAMAQGLTAQP